MSRRNKDNVVLIPRLVTARSVRRSAARVATMAAIGLALAGPAMLSSGCGSSGGETATLRPTPTPAADLSAAIAAANQRFEDAFAAQDAAAIAALYTPDALLLPPGTGQIAGRAGIQQFWQAVMTSGVRGAELTTVSLERSGDGAEEVGSYVLRGAAGQALDRGKYIVIWRREGSEWRLHRDIFNTDLP
jgi:uncharacterized protein (TIGR02246 family)